MLQILSVLESETGVASPAVSEIVEHIWREAVGEVESVLQVPVTSVKLDQVTLMRVFCTCCSLMSNWTR